MANENTSPFNAREEERKLMTDRHLNLFHCYSARSREGKPVEDNLTRAFIQTIRMLSSRSRKRFLDALFARFEHLKCDFSQADVALQGNIPDVCHPRSVKYAPRGVKYDVKRIVTIATSTRSTSRRVPEEYSRPDAWIFDTTLPSYCLLVESKCRGDSVSPEQLQGHAEYFDWDWRTLNWEAMKLDPYLLTLTWYDVLGVIDEAIPELSDADSRTAEIALRLNDQEKMVLTHLWVFIGYYGYRLFKGFRFRKHEAEQPAYDWRLSNVLREKR